MEINTDIKLFPLTEEHLEQVNAVIEAAVMTWDLPVRVKRLSMPSYRYDSHDLEHLMLVGAEDAAGALIGVGAWEPASAAETPDGSNGLLLHGLYVSPERYRTGIGSRLLDAAIQAAREGGFDGLLVKANPDAQGFFVAKGMRRLATENARRDYPYKENMVCPYFSLLFFSVPIFLSIFLDRPASPEIPEADIRDAVLKYLALAPQVAWAQRFNTGAHVIESRKANGKKSRRFVQYAFPGCADILGQLADGRFLAVECKRRTGRLKSEQAAFLETVNRAGGLGIVARCVEDVQDELFDDQRQRRKSA